MKKNQNRKLRFATLETVQIKNPPKLYFDKLSIASEGEGGEYRNRTDDLLTASQTL